MPTLIYCWPSFSQGALAEECRREGQVAWETYVPEGLRMQVTLGARLLEETKEYCVEEDG